MKFFQTRKPFGLQNLFKEKVSYQAQAVIKL